MSKLDPGVPGLNHLCLAVVDLKASLAFYDVLMPMVGWRPRRSEQSTAYVAGNYELYLQAAKEPGYGPRRFGVGLQHLALNAASPEVVDAVYRKMRELGAEVTDAPAHYPQYSPGYYAVFFKDPSGIQLEVCHTPDMEL